jgi:hypothetical protein
MRNLRRSSGWRWLVCGLLCVFLTACDDNDGPEPITLELEEGCNPFATSGDCLLPFPSSFYQVEDPYTATGYRVNYPPDAIETGPSVPPIDVEPTNAADGC